MTSYTLEDLMRDLDVPRETMDRLEVYANLLQKWQKAKNLVANSTLDDMWRRHFLDSAQLLPHLVSQFDPSVQILDIGSGAGFPGLVLSVMGFGRVHMVESNGKKCSFMGQVARATGANALIHNERIENMPPFEADIITSRACARIDQLLDWAAPFTGKKTEFWFLKGETAHEELTEAQNFWNMHSERFPSLTDAKGSIVRLWNVSKK